MNKYDIKVGDYIETWDGDIGVVEEVNNSVFVYNFTFVSNLNNYVKNVEYWCPFDAIGGFKPFKRIGVNDFSEKEAKLKPIESLDTAHCFTFELVSKTNELIDHINAIQERLNKYDSERTN